MVDFSFICNCYCLVAVHGDKSDFFFIFFFTAEIKEVKAGGRGIITIIFMCFLLMFVPR